MGGVRNRWINLIHEIMIENKRGYGVDELRQRLFDKMRDPARDFCFLTALRSCSI